MRLENAPPFVRPGILKLMQKRARERGRTVIDSEFLTEIRNESMLLVAKCIRGFGFEELCMDAFEVAKARMQKLPRKVAVIEEIKKFLGERTEKNEMILAKFRRYLELIPERGLPWSEEALARLGRVPGPFRAAAEQTIEAEARRLRARLVTGELVERVMGSLAERGRSAENQAPRSEGPLPGVTMLWTAEAEERLRRIPLPFVREMIIRRVEAHAQRHGLEVVDLRAYLDGSGASDRT